MEIAFFVLTVGHTCTANHLIDKKERLSMNELLTKIALPQTIETALNDGASLVISISGGKDSDATCELLPLLHRSRGWTGKLVLVHADLKGSEWSMTSEYVQRRAAELDLPLYIVTRERGSLLEQMQQRHAKRPDVPPFPSAAARYCTADNKRIPIDGFLRRFQPAGTVICAVGLRAEESPDRARKPIFRQREQVTTQRRLAYDWHPLFNFATEDVWATLGVSTERLRGVRERVRAIRMSGGTWQEAITATQWRWHPAYALGNERLSCSICVLASKNDLLNGIEFHPDYYRQLVQLEIDSGFSFRQGLWLGDLRPDLLSQSQKVQLEKIKKPTTKRIELSTLSEFRQLTFQGFAE
jgi:3'-phosphoadenosine 5'-phosphosulfate sulfotransferase (PAPS reductase)/FAD synthetase